MVCYNLGAFRRPEPHAEQEQLAMKRLPRLAGANTVFAARLKPPLILTRADAFIGVIVDDLTSRGAQ